VPYFPPFLGKLFLSYFRFEVSRLLLGLIGVATLHLPPPPPEKVTDVESRRLSIGLRWVSPFRLAGAGG